MFLFLPQLLVLLGATSSTFSACKIYASIWLLGVPAVIGKELFAYFIRADGSPGYSFFLSVTGGISNIMLDYLFVARMNMGIFGAGLATILLLNAVASQPAFILLALSISHHFLTTNLRQFT